MKAVNFFRPISFSLQWHLTERCNWSCKHCYREKGYVEELPLKDLKRIFLQYLDLLETLKIRPLRARLNFAGGEPFIREDFLRFLSWVSRYKNLINIGILTNGSFISQEIIKELKSLNCIHHIQLSIEGFKENNDYIRGKGSFERILFSCEKLIKFGIRTVISLTLTRLNREDLSGLIYLFQKKGVSGFGARRFVPIGRGKTLSRYMLSPMEQREVYLQREKMRNNLQKKNSKFHLWFGCEDGILSQEVPAQFSSCSYRGECGAVTGCALTIFPNADIVACRRLPIVVGNALKENLSKIHFSSKKLWQIRNLNNAHPLCKSCQFFKFCLGGARCVIWGYYKRLGLPDPQCWRIFKNKLPPYDFFR